MPPSGPLRASSWSCLSCRGFLPGSAPDEIKSRAETRGGAFEKALAPTAQAGKGYLVGSYPERDGDKIFHTVVLAGPEGAILARYRVTHPSAAHAAWASAGDRDHGRRDAAWPDRIRFCRRDLRARARRALRRSARRHPRGPGRLARAAQGRDRSRLCYSVADPPTGRAEFFPYACAKLNQFWLVSGGRRVGDRTSAAIYGPEPVVSTPTLTARAGEPAVRYQTIVPAPGTWINQTQLIDGQQAQWFPPLVLQEGNACLERWRRQGVGPTRCR